RAAEACDERRREAAVPLAPAFHGATWTLAGSLSPVSSRAPPDSPSPDWVPPVPSAGWPPMVRAAARASAVDWSALAPVLEIPTRLETWAAVAVAAPVGAGSAEAATGVNPMRRHAGAAAERIDRRMVLLSRRGRGWRRCRSAPIRAPRTPGTRWVNLPQGREKP